MNETNNLIEENLVTSTRLSLPEIPTNSPNKDADYISGE